MFLSIGSQRHKCLVHIVVRRTRQRRFRFVFCKPMKLDRGCSSGEPGRPRWVLPGADGGWRGWAAPRRSRPSDRAAPTERAKPVFFFYRVLTFLLLGFFFWVRPHLKGSLAVAEHDLVVFQQVASERTAGRRILSTAEKKTMAVYRVLRKIYFTGFSHHDGSDLRVGVAAVEEPVDVARLQVDGDQRIGHLSPIGKKSRFLLFQRNWVGKKKRVTFCR